MLAKEWLVRRQKHIDIACKRDDLAFNLTRNYAPF